MESDLPACGPQASFSVHLASSVVTPRGQPTNPVEERGEYVGAVEENACDVTYYEHYVYIYIYIYIYYIIYKTDRQINY